MAIVKQTSHHQRKWSDWLPHVVCVAAVLTLISAAVAGIFSQRIGTLATAHINEQAKIDATATEALKQAKAQWQKTEASLEKELLSAKLKLKAEQKTSASIRNRLVKLQKDLAAAQAASAKAAVKHAAGAEVVEAVAPAAASVPIATQKAATDAGPERTSLPPATKTATAASGAAVPEAQPVGVAPAPQPQTVTAQPGSPAAQTDTPAAPSASKASVAPAEPAVQPVELAPPGSVEEAPAAQVPVVEE